MADASFVFLDRVSCLSSDDTLGGDTLVGRFDDDKGQEFSIGRFSQGDSVTGIEVAVPPGSSSIYIYDTDLVFDDLIGIIRLDAEVDIERELILSSGSASYEFVFTVVSESSRSRSPKSSY